MHFYYWIVFALGMLADRLIQHYRRSAWFRECYQSEVMRTSLNTINNKAESPKKDSILRPAARQLNVTESRSDAEQLKVAESRSDAEQLKVAESRSDAEQFTIQSRPDHDDIKPSWADQMEEEDQ